MRSLLTMLGIIIGVSAVIIIVAIGEGAKTELNDQMFGGDKNAVELYFEPYGMADQSEMMSVAFDETLIEEEPELTDADLKAVQAISGVKIAIGSNDGFGGTFVHNENQGELQITGVGTDYFVDGRLKIVEGRAFNTRDIDSLGRVVMIDTETRKAYFKEADQVVGEIVEINSNPYKVIGVYESLVPEMYRMGGGEALMPRTLSAMMFGMNEITKVTIYAEDVDGITQTATMAAAKLTERAGLEEAIYTFYDMSEYEEEAKQALGIVTLFISSIAGISLLVGGIGVMNIMLVSVTERTREIGLRKAIGATRGKILLQFLIESVTLTSVGGLIGIGFAVMVTMIASKFLPFQAVINPSIVVLGVTFSAFIGIVFGILPANKASKLSPIEALRHE